MTIPERSEEKLKALGASVLHRVGETDEKVSTDDRIRESLAPVVVWGYLILVAFLCLTAVGFGYIQNKSPIPDLMEILKIGALPVVSFVLGRFFK